MSEDQKKKKGLRCLICTGCGLCPGITPTGSAAGNVRVLDEDALLGESRPLPGKNSYLAVADIGTTTVAMLLYGPEGKAEDRYLALNPQSVYGADVISRIRAAQDGHKAEQMREMIRELLEKGIARFRKKIGEDASLSMTLAANTTETYLLMGWDTKELGAAPFSASRLKAVQTDMAGVPCFVFPGMSAFVGGDITAGVHACGMAEREDITLLIDLGTNGEMVLGNRHRRIACATAAGPAFEGGASRGIWGADMISFLAALKKEGILDETGLLAEPFFEKGVRIGNVLVTKEAVRSVQLAKGAIAAGITILLRKYGITADRVDRVVLAGGFGYYLKPEDAAEIGLIPAALSGKSLSGGNTVLSGGLKAGRELLAEGGDIAGRLEEITSETEVINLAKEAEFQEAYIRSLNLEKY